MGVDRRGEEVSNGSHGYESMDAVDAVTPKRRPIPVPTPIKQGQVGTYEIAKAYLESLHATLWPGEAWYIRDEDGQDAAAVWITKMVDTVNAIRNMVNASESGMTVQQAAEDYRRMTEGC